MDTTTLKENYATKKTQAAKDVLALCAEVDAQQEKLAHVWDVQALVYGLYAINLKRRCELESENKALHRQDKTLHDKILTSCTCWKWTSLGLLVAGVGVMTLLNGTIGAALSGAGIVSGLAGAYLLGRLR